MPRFSCARCAIVICVLGLHAGAAIAQSPQPDKAAIRAQKNEELAREKSAIRTPNDPLKALAVREEIMAKRAQCSKQASEQKLHFGKRRAFMKACEGG